MPDFAFLHPIIVHFTVALLVVGVVLRWISLANRWPFVHPAAVLLILIGTATTVVAVKSGDDAHGPAERIPGVRPAVHEHEEHGERARDVFLLVVLLEVVALALARKGHARTRQVIVASALVGAIGLFFLYEAAEHGGELVYTYAGGVGTRSGEPEDVGRLLLAGLYHQGKLDREAGRTEQAGQLFELASERFPADLDVQLLYADSLLQDLKDPQAALDLLRRLEAPEGGFAQLRHGLLVAEALKATGDAEAGRQELESLKQIFPRSRMLARALESF